MFRKILLVILVMALAAPVVACGRKSAPKPPDDAPSRRTYPAG
jgi:hypothetical protein